MHRTQKLLWPLGLLFLIPLLSAFHPSSISLLQEDLPNPTPEPVIIQTLRPVENVTDITAGIAHTCLITEAGGVKCWGYNDAGQLGDGTTENSTVPVDVFQLGAGVRYLSASEENTCAVLEDGTAKCWGNNFNGQLGNGTTESQLTPVDVVGLEEKVIAIAAGDSHTCILTQTGRVQCWGFNNYHRLGDGTEEDSLTPVDVQGLSSGVQAIGAGSLHTCALTNEGGVKCWGAPFMLGAETREYGPIDVPGLDSGVTSIAVGPMHTCAARENRIYCWGGNQYGQLGDGNRLDLQQTPVEVKGISGPISALAVGAGHTCALVEDDVLCWGWNAFGQLGDGTGEERLEPTPVNGLKEGVIGLTAGVAHSCALYGDGTVACWGLHREGLLGDGPVDVSQPSPVDVVGLDDFVETMDAGEASTCAVMAAGGVKCWGLPDSFGSGYKLIYGAERNVGLAQAVGTFTGKFKTLAVGESHTCGLTEGGGVKCWGDNLFGQLGDGTDEDREEPVDVLGLTSGVTALSTGADHTCAVTSAGAVFCWGRNFNGTLGDGGTEDSNTPIQVPGLNSGVVSIATGDWHTCALTAQGEIYCWGNNIAGVLGDGTIEDHLTPVRVTVFTEPAIDIAAGHLHTCALTTDRTVWCWGDNQSGQLGNGTSDYFDTAVQASGLSDIQSIDAGYDHTCALSEDGHVFCWGSNNYGQTGSDTGEFESTPVEVSGLGRNILAVSTGAMHSCALTGDGEVKCWGNNTLGQLGDDSLISKEPITVMEPGPVVSEGFRPTGPLVPELTTYIPTPLDVSTQPAVVGTNLALAAVMMLPFAIAAEIFTQIILQNAALMRLGSKPIRGVALLQERLNALVGTKLRGFALLDILKLIGVMLFYGLIFSLLDRSWKPLTLTGVVLFIEMTFAYGIVGLADDLMQWRAARRLHLPGDLTVKPTHILLAMLSTGTSRILNLVPGLMFGTPEAFEMDEETLDKPTQAHLQRISAITLTVVGVGIWVPTAITAWLQRKQLSEGLANMIGGLEGFLLVIFAVALENIFIQLLGFPGSLGYSLRQRRRGLWLAALVGVTFLFYHTLINPRGELAQALTEGNVRFFLIVVGAFVAVTFLLWLFTKLRARPQEVVTDETTITVEPPSSPLTIGTDLTHFIVAPEHSGPALPTCAECQQTFTWEESFRQQDTPGSKPYNAPAGGTFRPRVFCPHCGALVAEWHTTPQKDFDEWIWFGEQGATNEGAPLPPSPILYGGGIDLPVQFHALYDEHSIDVAKVKAYLETRQPSTVEEPRPWQQAFDESFKRFQAGDLPGALSTLQEAIAAGLPEKEQSTLHGAVGEFHLIQNKDVDTAYGHLLKSVDLDPGGFWKAHFYLSLIYQARGEIEKAEAAFREAQRYAQTIWFTPEAELQAREIVAAWSTSEVIQPAALEPSLVSAEVVPESEGMKTCPQCGQSIKLEARICRYCRVPFQITVKGYCMNCHAVVDLDAHDRCQTCGNEIVDRHVVSHWLGKPSSPPVQSVEAQTPTPAVAISSSVTPPKPAPVKKRAQRSLARWIFSALFLVIGGGIIVTQLVKTPDGTPLVMVPFLSNSPTPTASEVPATETQSIPTPTVTPRSSPTNTPEPTPTPLPAWIEDFANPILGAIADRSPTREDDFSGWSWAWNDDCEAPQPGYVDGELILQDCQASRGLWMADFVAEIDARFLAGQPDSSWWHFKFRTNGLGDYAVAFSHDGRVSLRRNGEILDEIKGWPVLSGDQTDHLMVMAKGSEIAVYVNQEPLFWTTDSTAGPGGIWLAVGTAGTYTSDPTSVGFDNFKIWDISDLP